MIAAVAQALPALQGFFTIGVLIGVGWLLAAVGVLGLTHRQMMSHIALYIASPALMFTTISQADLGHVFAWSVVASYGAIMVAGGIGALAARLWFHHGLADSTISTLLACYSNAGNLGIPVAAYALGDVTWMAPILVIQMVVLQPAALAILDLDQARREGATVSVSRLATLPLRNPLTVGVLLGLAANLIHARLDWFVLPAFVAHPVDMVGAIAVPLMLLAFGVSLRVDPKPDHGPDEVESWLLAATKVVLQPVVAYLLAAWVLHLTPVAVRAVTVVACLPPAQNIFIFASKYNVRMVFARDTIFRATFCSVAVILVAAVVLA